MSAAACPRIARFGLRVAAACTIALGVARADDGTAVEETAPTAYLGVYAKSNRNVLDADNVYPGITVSKVVENSPAEAAGLRVGDILLEGNGTKLSHPDRLADLLDATPIGAPVELRVERNARVLDVALITVERRAPPETGASEAAPDLASSELRVERRRLGIEFREAGEDRLVALGLSPRFGVEIVRLADRSPLRRVGVREGEILYAIGGEPIPSAQDLLDFLDQTDAVDALALTVYGAEGPRELQVAPFRPGLRLKKLSIPLVFSLERGPDRSEYAALLAAFRWTRFENGSNIRLLWLIEIETGSSEELLEVGGG